MGLIVKEGVIVASDSQVTFSRGADVKRINSNKVYRLLEDRNVAVAGTGLVSSIQKAIESIRTDIMVKETSEKIKLSLPEIIDVAEASMATLHKTYNVERTKFLYGEGQPPSGDFGFDAMLILGGIDDKDLKRVAILFQNGVSEPVSDYATIGSGAAYAEYLLAKLYRFNMSLESAKRIALYVIEEVEKIAPDVGGPINVVAVSKDAYQDMAPERISELLKSLTTVEDTLAEVRRKLIDGTLDVEKVRKLQ